jgi:hypothetical protein
MNSPDTCFQLIIGGWNGELAKGDVANERFAESLYGIFMTFYEQAQFNAARPTG